MSNRQSLWKKAAELDRKAANESDPKTARQLRELADEYQGLASTSNVESSDGLR